MRNAASRRSSASIRPISGPAAGGARFWHYEDDGAALTDALRLSRGMSYKNAMAGLPLGGGKSVILANAERSKTPELLHAFGKAVDQLCGRYVTAEDVGMSVHDMIEVARSTTFVAGLPNTQGDVGGDPGPHTSLGVFLGIKAAVKRALGKDSLDGPAHRHAGRGQRRQRGRLITPRPRARVCRSPMSMPKRRRGSPMRSAARSSRPTRSSASRPMC